MTYHSLEDDKHFHLTLVLGSTHMFLFFKSLTPLCGTVLTEQMLDLLFLAAAANS